MAFPNSGLSIWGCLTCLSVSKDASVVALEGVVQDAVAHALKDGLLAGEVRVVRVHGVEAVVESERLWWFPAEKRRQFNIIIVTQNMHFLYKVGKIKNIFRYLK